MLLELGIFATQPLCLGGAADQMQQALGLERLLDEVHRTAPDRRYRRIDVAVPGKDDHWQLGFANLDRVEHLEPIHRRTMQPHVEQDQTGPPLINGFQRGTAVARGPAIVTFITQHAGDKFANVAFVIDDQDIERHGDSLLCTARHGEPA